MNPTVLNVHVSLIKEWLITGSYLGWHSYLISTLFITWALEHGGMDLSGPNIILEILVIGNYWLLSTKREFYFFYFLKLDVIASQELLNMQVTPK